MGDTAAHEAELKKACSVFLRNHTGGNLTLDQKKEIQEIRMVFDWLTDGLPKARLSVFFCNGTKLQNLYMLRKQVKILVHYRHD